MAAPMAAPPDWPFRPYLRYKAATETFPSEPGRRPMLSHRIDTSTSWRTLPLLVAVCLALAGAACGNRELLADRSALAAAPPELLSKLRADPYNYFRFVNHEWTSRVCEVFGRDLASEPIVQLHGDAHLEQY